MNTGLYISPHGDQWGLFGDYSSVKPGKFGKDQNPEGLNIKAFRKDQKNTENRFAATTNQKVVGSNPAGLTEKETSKEASFSLYFKDSIGFALILIKAVD